jgi:hypothetical protein
MLDSCGGIARSSDKCGDLNGFICLAPKHDVVTRIQGMSLTRPSQRSLPIKSFPGRNAIDYSGLLPALRLSSSLRRAAGRPRFMTAPVVNDVMSKRTRQAGVSRLPGRTTAEAM